MGSWVDTFCTQKQGSTPTLTGTTKCKALFKVKDTELYCVGSSLHAYVTVAVGYFVTVMLGLCIILSLFLLLYI